MELSKFIYFCIVITIFHVACDRNQKIKMSYISKEFTT